MSDQNMAKLRSRLIATGTLSVALFFATPIGLINAQVPGNGQTVGLRADVAELVSKAEQAKKSGRPDVALIYLKNAEAKAPNVGSIHFSLGEVLLNTNNPSEGERELNIALQQGVPRSQVLPLLWQSMLAQRKAQALLDRYPEPPATDKTALASDLLRMRATAFLQIGRRDAAIASFDKAVAVTPSAQNLSARGQLALDLNDVPGASKFVDEALKREPADPRALMLKIALLQRTNQPNQALPFAHTLVKVTNGAPLATLNRAGVLLQLKQDKNALADLNATLARAPNMPLAVFYKAVILGRANDAKGAWALAQTLPRELRTTRPEIGLALGQMALAVSQKEVAADIWNSVVQNFPANSDARIRLAALYLDMKETARARQTIAPLQGTSDARANAIFAQLSANDKNPKEALQYLQRASEGGFGGDALKLRLATAHIQSGKLQEARVLLEEMLRQQPGRADAAGQLITVYLRQGEVSAAEKLAATIASAAPKAPAGPFYQGQIALQRGDTDKAIAFFSTAIERDRKFVPALYARANALADKGQTERAIAGLREIVNADPKNSLAALRLSGLLQQTGDTAGAIDLLKRTSTLNPTDISLVSALSVIYGSQGRWKEALQVTESFLRGSPNSAAGLTAQARIQVSSGANDVAIKTLTGLVKRDTGSIEPLLLIARAHQNKREFSVAQNYLKRAVTLQPRSVPARTEMIRSFIGARDLPGALREAQAFAKEVPGPVADQELALMYVANKQPKQAEALLRTSLTRQPNTRTAIQLSALLNMQGNAKGAETVLAAWLTKQPRDASALQAYGLVLMPRNKNLAEQKFEQALSVNPADVVSLNNLAWLRGQRDLKSAKSYADRALRLAPNAAQVLDTSGWIEWRLGNRARALELLQRANSRDAKSPIIGYHYATALAGSGRRAEADKLLTASLANGAAFAERSEAQELLSRIRGGK